MTSKLASLHAGLVARKGEAMPALTNPALTYVDTPRPVHETSTNSQRHTMASALGQPPAVATTPANRFSSSKEEEPVAVPSLQKPLLDTEEGSHHGPYRLSFRMTKDQRRRLRIAAAQNDRSLQQMLSVALDNHLDGLCACSLKECACLARKK